MRRTALFFSTLFLVTGISFAQTAPDESSSNQAESRDAATPQNEALDNAPIEVKEQIMRHASVQTMKELDAAEVNGATVYEAVFEEGNVETTLRLSSDGSPLSMHIASTGRPAVDEAAGARRETEQEARPAQAPAQPAAAQEQKGVPDSVRQRIEQQLGEVPLLDVQPKVFYQLNVRQNGSVQQVWADENGTLLRE